MSCSIVSVEEIEELQKQSSVGYSKFKAVPKDQQNLIRLPRGGILLETPAGNVQFGMPPETVKDAIVMGLEVPCYYVLPRKRFDFKLCLNVAEFEFPAYFNFFIRKRQVTLICDNETEQAIRTVFQETLLGPLDLTDFDKEFSNDYDISKKPDLKKEMGNFAKNPFNPSEPLTVETLVKFINYDDKDIAKISDEVFIERGDQSYRVNVNNKTVAVLPDAVEIQIEDDGDVKDYENVNKANLSKLSEVHINDLRGGFQINNLEPIQFDPPEFGVTVLGNSHGFDPKGSTSGYIIWVNGRGVMVDPPPFSTIKLKKMGIPDSLIEWVIISHCHGDHDAGVFQKILDTEKVEVITTRTIMGSFLRKYSAITGLKLETTKSLFKFRPVTIGQPCHINGGQFKFFYSLHTIPCIGFTASFNGKSLYFSGDTFYWPEKMQEMVNKGVLSQGRCDDLCDNKFKHDLILHEAGVPPIHTPMKVLADLPDDVKKNMYLVHVAAKDIIPDSGLRQAPIGIENTVVLEKANSEENKDKDLLGILDIVCSIELFQRTPLRSLRDLIQSARVEHFDKDDQIIKEGTKGDKFYIILSGIIKAYSEKPGNKFERFYQLGDYFGETILNTEGLRTASVIAINRARALSLTKSDFIFIFGDNNQIMNRMTNLVKVRKNNSIKTIRKNSVFQTLASSQKLQLEGILQLKKVDSQASLWKRGDNPSFVFLIYKGAVEVTFRPEGCEEDDDETDEYTSGAFIGETAALLKNGVCKTSVRAVDDLHMFVIEKSDYLAFLDSNPKLLVNLTNEEVIE